ncbi:hypothetical protein JTE90_003951 [Oedothorax gibbosus]|uniref:Uncharacterized protein n=1 Tax=Oedothorax gibbosus TaxID=931172 RepID=A0AAV6UWI7_9ARAC|nr:hypothetical protein JTE90_003951 [Oedothorax gibbosus]
MIHYRNTLRPPTKHHFKTGTRANRDLHWPNVVVRPPQAPKRGSKKQAHKKNLISNESKTRKKKCFSTSVSRNWYLAGHMAPVPEPGYSVIRRHYRCVVRGWVGDWASTLHLRRSCRVLLWMSDTRGHL